MRLPTQYNQRTPLRFNITPLIDVVFLLIIFFLVASHFVRSEQAEAVELPRATGALDDEEQVQNRLTITIAQDGSLFVAGQPHDQATVFRLINELKQATQDSDSSPELRLRGHRSGRYGPMRQLIEHAAAQGIRSIRFAVDVEDRN